MKVTPGLRHSPVQGIARPLFTEQELEKLTGQLRNDYGQCRLVELRLVSSQAAGQPGSRHFVHTHHVMMVWVSERELRTPVRAARPLEARKETFVFWSADRSEADMFVLMHNSPSTDPLVLLAMNMLRTTKMAQLNQYETLR